MKPNKFLIPLSLLILFAGLLVAFSLVKLESVRFNYAHYSLLNEGWSHEAESLSALPIDLNTPTGAPAIIHRTLGDDFSQGRVLLIRTSLQDLIVKLDGDIIYSYTSEPIGRMNTYASLWHLVPLPSDSDGSTLEMTFTSPYRAMSGRINPIVYGCIGELNYYLFMTFGFRFIIGLIVVLIGIFLVVLNALAYRKYSESASLAGLTAFFLGFWIMAESRMLQYVIGHPVVIGSLAYVSLAMIPITIGFYIQRHVLTLHRKAFFGMVLALILNLVFVIVAHVSGILDFFESVVITQIMTVIGIIVTGVFLVIEGKHKSQNIRQFVSLLVFISVIGIIELINFLFQNYDKTSVFTASGIAVLIIFLFFRYVKHIFVNAKIVYEQEIYRKLAYMDPLTKLKNRLAFNEKLDALFQEGPNENLTIIFFDLNELKKINDTYGHHEGDEALVEIGKRILSVYDTYGDVYRVGGDEFVFIGERIPIADYERINQAFDQTMLQENQDKPLPLHISYGMTHYQPETDQSPKDILTRADREMYLDKMSKRKTKANASR
ncbi:MAG: GGDEF domain-containing protein [Candidatus Izemoplasmatales bacterium]|nr:GGDEF domain-containing protein [Candidatus Izemoplasmatales bacterium]